MKVYLNDGKKSVDPRLHLKRVDSTDRDHCARERPLITSDIRVGKGVQNGPQNGTL